MKPNESRQTRRTQDRSWGLGFARRTDVDETAEFMKLHPHSHSECNTAKAGSIASSPIIDGSKLWRTVDALLEEAWPRRPINRAFELKP